jgi:hypothetical protein
MMRATWWLVDRISRLLDRDEREAVRGDFAEWELTGGEALRDLVGLIVRRHASVWAGWRPWLALLALVAPIGMLLSLASRNWSSGWAIGSFLYANNWTWGYLESPGARIDLAQTIGGVCLGSAALMVWSWTIGFALASLAPRAVGINGALFCLVVFGGTIGSTTTGMRGNDAVFSIAFYRVALPAIVRGLLVLVPAVCGMREGTRTRQASIPLPRAIFCIAIVIVATVASARGLEGSLLFGWVSPSGSNVDVTELSRWRGSWKLHLLPLVMMWPAAFIVASARRRRARTPSTVS